MSFSWDSYIIEGGSCILESNFWETEVVLGETGKNKNEKIIVKRVTKAGKEYREIRVYYTSRDGEYLPSRKGVVIPENCCREVSELLLNEEVIV